MYMGSEWEVNKGHGTQREPADELGILRGYMALNSGAKREHTTLGIQ